MKKQFLLVFLIFAVFITLNTVSATDENSSDLKSDIYNTNIPFVENQGQVDDEVEYYADTFYGNVYVTQDSITHSIQADNNTSMVIKEQFMDREGNIINFNPAGHDISTAKVDYYLGNDPQKWITSLAAWDTVTLGQLYPGIELILKANGSNIEKIFQIYPGGNPEDIRIMVTGADSLKLNDSGDLNLETSKGIIRLTKPVAFQEDQHSK
ncbi:MAG: hypothetical protein ACP5C3_00550 [Methanomicrobiales archaeon]